MGVKQGHDKRGEGRFRAEGMSGSRCSCRIDAGVPAWNLDRRHILTFGGILNMKKLRYLTIALVLILAALSVPAATAEEEPTQYTSGDYR